MIVFFRDTTMNTKYCTIVFVGIVTMMTNLQPCFGFALDRTEIRIPVMWNVPLPLQSESTMSIKSSSDKKAEPADLNKVVEILEPKKMTEDIEQASFFVPIRGKRLQTVLEEKSKVAEQSHKVEESTIVTLKENTSKSINNSAPRNVVLLLVDNGAKNEHDLWEDFKPGSFPVERFLQACQNNKHNKSQFFLDDELTSEDKDRECECQHVLRMNVASLLAWARNSGHMATGAILATNFTIPSLPTYVESTDETKEIEEFDVNNGKLKVHHEKPKVEDWHVINLGITPGHASSTMLNRSAKQKETTQNGDTWDMFDFLSRMRLLLFRTLLESLGRRMNNPGDDFFAKKSHSRRSSLVELVGNTIRELKSVAKEKGYVLAVVAPGSEVTSVVGLLETEITEKDTLLVITEICSHGSKPVHLFAQGPAAKDLQNVKAVSELPTALERFLASRCHSTDCEVSRNSNSPFDLFRIFRHDLMPLSGA